MDDARKRCAHSAFALQSEAPAGCDKAQQALAADILIGHPGSTARGRELGNQHVPKVRPWATATEQEFLVCQIGPIEEGSFSKRMRLRKSHKYALRPKGKRLVVLFLRFAGDDREVEGTRLEIQHKLGSQFLDKSNFDVWKSESIVKQDRG
jgi:hypothetical protein